MLTEQQRAILAELETRQLSPEQQMIVQELKSRDVAQVPDPIQSEMALRANTMSMNPTPPGVVPMEATGQIPLMNENQVADVIGEKAAEAGHPLVGGAIQMTPRVSDAAYTLAMMGGPSGVVEAGKGIGSLAKSGTQGLKNLGKRAITGPATEQVMALRNEIGNLPLMKEAKLAQLESMRGPAGEALANARAASGFPQTPLADIRTPKQVEKFGDVMKKIGDMKPKEVLSKWKPEDLAKFKDTVQVMRDNGVVKEGTRLSAQLSKGIDGIDNALGTYAPQYGEALGSYRDIRAAQEAVPSDMLAKKVALAKQLREAQVASHGEKMRRKIAGYAVGGGSLLEALRRLAGGH